MIVLDAYALIALFLREGPWEQVAALLARPGSAAISVANLAEVSDQLVRVHGLEAQEVRRAVETLVRTDTLEVRIADAETAWRASAVRTAHYRRRTSELSLADCFLLASAKPGEDAIATSDPPVAAAARALGIELVALPDSVGRRP